MAPTLGRLALPISDELVAAIERFDCIGEGHADDDVFGASLEFSDFGAIRIQMIGVDHRAQQRGYGKALLRFVTERAHRLSTNVPARFLLADANVRQVDWYERRGFVRNRSRRAQSAHPERTVSMRLDLGLGLASATADEVPAMLAARAGDR